MQDKAIALARCGLGIAVAAGIVACEPPPAPSDAGGEPAIEMIYPPSDIGTIPLTQEGSEQFLDLFLVVDIENLEYVPPVDSPEDVEGQGHYHFNVNDAYVDAPPARFYEFRSDPGEFKAGDRVKVSVTLASNTHQDLDTFANWIDVAEFTVGEPLPSTVDTDTSGDTDDTDGSGT